jgi:hypothetical protein
MTDDNWYKPRRAREMAVQWAEAEWKHIKAEP